MKRILMLIALIGGLQGLLVAEELPPVPPQDQGIPYTRSAQPMAMKELGKRIAVYPGSPYAMAHGVRTRLDSERPLAGKAVEVGGVLYVPGAFAPLVLADSRKVQADQAPPEIADRYIHQLSAPAVAIPPQVRQIMVEGNRYVSLMDLAKLSDRPWVRHPRGLFVIGDEDFDFLSEPYGLDRVITLFDTPDLLADPDIALQHVPLLKRQGKWTDHVKHTPEQLKLLEGAETPWPLVPKADYDLSGFDARLLGSAVPAPGVYPRLIMSPEDLPMWREEVQRDPVKAYSYAETEALLKTTWLDPTTDDGRMFERLASGEPLKLEELSQQDREKPEPFPDSPLFDKAPMIRYSHTPYIGHCLVSILQLALLRDDDELGCKAATAAVTYLQMHEPAMDAYNAMSDSEFGSERQTAGGGTTAYRFRCKVDHMSLPWLLDFGGKYMTPDQIDFMRRLIAKTTYGMADSHAAGSLRWIENNHTTWHTTIFLMQFVIEGLPGSDPENFARASRTIRAFCEFGIDRDGVVFETNGKSGAGFNMFSFNLIALARRGENYFGHPHLRELPKAQVLASAPDGSLTVTSGAFAGRLLEPQFLMVFKNFYPDNLYVDWLLEHRLGEVDYSPAAREAHVEELLAGNRGIVRLPVFSSPVSPRTLLLDNEYNRVPRSDLDLPLSFSAEEHGLFSAYSDGSEAAAFVNLLVRENGYLGAGHHHADSGMFHFSSHGVNWFGESSEKVAHDGNLHNHVRIDGKSTPNKPAPTGFYLGARDDGQLAFAAADISRAYDFAYIQQLFFWDEPNWWHENAPVDDGVEFEDDPRVIAAFKGTQHYKMRNWWPSYNFSNWIPTCRTPYNPVDHALRAFGLVRGPRNYAVLMDEVKKDDQSRHYEWSGCTGRGVWLSDDASRAAGLPAGQQLVLGWEGPGARKLSAEKVHHLDRPEPVSPKAGEPQLLVCLLNRTQAPDGRPLLEMKVDEGPFDQRFNKRRFYDNLLIHHEGSEGSFRVLMIPFRRGEALPIISYDEDQDVAVLRWDDQEDQIRFDRVDNHLVLQLERRTPRSPNEVE